ncbi:MAG: hypothetical protein ACTSX2_01325 [Candidatus Thorarchaeota archaeon]
MSIIDYHVRARVENAPDYYYREVQTDVLDFSFVDPANPGLVHRDRVLERTTDNEPTAVAAGLNITTNVGSVIVDDVTAITADPDDTKYVKVSVVRDDASTLLEIQVEEKVLGNYSGTPEGKTLECEIKEFSLVAAGTDLVEV